MLNPTAKNFKALTDAHRYFNETLFGDKLPEAMFSFSANPHSRGHYAPDRWAHGKALLDEIAINGNSLSLRSDMEVLSTLVHEMCHQWQAHFGKPSRGAYHNRQWADKMKAVGLQSTDTGKPGGKETGQKMTHYINAGEPFDCCANDFIKDGFVLEYSRRSDALKAGTPKSGKRIKYQCPVCKIAVWGKPDLSLLCLDDERQLMLA